jgi:osmoprotectant transport system permease protein
VLSCTGLGRALLGFLLGLLLGGAAWAQDERIVIASKAFPESWVLGQALCDLAREAGATVEYRKNLGATEVIYQALLKGEIDVYPEYTGTIKKVFLKDLHDPSDADAIAVLALDGIGMSYPLGFNDGYAMAVPQASPLRTLSDLAAHPDLRLVMDSEFRGRQDGWPLLVAEYGIHPKSVVEMQHELGYTAVASGKADVVNVYTTDGQLQALRLRPLIDDKQAFPRYDAVLLYRCDLPARSPHAWASLCQLVGAISDEQMSRANAVHVVEKKGEEAAARSLLGEVLPNRLGAPELRIRSGRWDWPMMVHNVKRHMTLVVISLFWAIVAGIPLGILASRSALMATLTLSTIGLLQTIPSLALLAFLVPVMGVGAGPAVVALFLYSLLPIVRNTYTGLTTLPPRLSEAAQAIGLTDRWQLLYVRLPMASRAILSGIKTSAVINVGTATLAALVGAGGLGQPILQGIQLMDPNLIFQGAVPAGILALLVQGAFDTVERVVVPRGLKL